MMVVAEDAALADRAVVCSLVVAGEACLISTCRHRGGEIQGGRTSGFAPPHLRHFFSAWTCPSVPPSLTKASLTSTLILDSLILCAPRLGLAQGQFPSCSRPLPSPSSGVPGLTVQTR